MIQKTDICEHAIEVLRKSCVKTVHIVGRRGPLQVRYAIDKPPLTAAPLYNAHFFGMDCSYIGSCLNPSTMATSLQRPLFWGGLFIHWLLFKPLNDGHLSTTATFLGWTVHTLALV